MAQTEGNKKKVAKKLLLMHQQKVQTLGSSNTHNYIFINNGKDTHPMIYYTDNGHPERAFFQKFETFGLGQTNWAEILGGILAISSQTIGTILAL